MRIIEVEHEKVEAWMMLMRRGGDGDEAGMNT